MTFGRLAGICSLCVVKRGERRFTTDNIQLASTTVPEPASVVLVGLGIDGMFMSRRLRRQE
ncbi:PEP-CTERM sorting domain-containing protein [Gemmatimonas groenlandica]|uniref:PEP-CTERM sorting domain-containing protein n=1 Tax=Gemmatimonas groenlandica TaxID=2732249 RepID=A0A6M4IVJ4_9BACT|nr:PEP-CTERM sorting domain-containing protein [Gemmatimonas groenlandica]